jgi:putative exporter of polyketide antibiotics
MWADAEHYLHFYPVESLAILSLVVLLTLAALRFAIARIGRRRRDG